MEAKVVILTQLTQRIINPLYTPLIETNLTESLNFWKMERCAFLFYQILIEFLKKKYKMFCNVHTISLIYQDDLRVLLTQQIYVLSLTHWGRVTHICVGKLTIIGSDNGEILLIRPLGTNFSEILIGFQTFSFNKMHLKSRLPNGVYLSRPQCVNKYVGKIFLTRHVEMTCYQNWPWIIITLS